MIYPLRDHGISLRIKNVFKPQQPGTLIKQERPSAEAHLRAVTAIPALCVMGERSGDVTSVIELVQGATAAKIGQKADVMLTSQSSDQSSLCFVVPTTAGGAEAVENVRLAVEERLENFADRAQWSARAISVVTAIGTGFAYSTELQAQILQALSQTRILGMTQGPSQCSYSIMVEETDSESVLRQIHELVLNSG